MGNQSLLVFTSLEVHKNPAGTYRIFSVPTSVVDYIYTERTILDVREKCDAIPIFVPFFFAIILDSLSPQLSDNQNNI